MLYTSWNLAKKHHACIEALDKWQAAHPKIKFNVPIGGAHPIQLLDVLNILGLDNCLWAFRATTDEEATKIIAVKFAIACADRVLIHFESKYPNDKRPRQAIEAAQAFLLNPSQKTAHAAAYAAADAAAHAAERTWQTEKLRELLSE
jgi:hypothetical protein